MQMNVAAVTLDAKEK